jgi:hypothetical protein
MRGKFPVNMSTKSSSNISPNSSEVNNKVSEPYQNLCDLGVHDKFQIPGRKVSGCVGWCSYIILMSNKDIIEIVENNLLNYIEEVHLFYNKYNFNFK